LSFGAVVFGHRLCHGLLLQALRALFPLALGCRGGLLTFDAGQPHEVMGCCGEACP